MSKYRSFFIELDSKMLRHGSDGRVYMEKVDGLSKDAICVIDIKILEDILEKVKRLEALIAKEFE